MRKFKPLDKALRIESERLYLRPITEEDTDLVLSFRNADYVRNNFFYRNIITREQHLSYLHDKCEKGLIFHFLVYVKENDEPIGCVYLQHYNPEDDSLESGVFFSENAPKGKGYASEAVKLMNQYAFENLGVSKTIARVIATNTASMKLHEYVGFEESYRSDEEIVPSGEIVEAVTFDLYNPNKKKSFFSGYDKFDLIKKGVVVLLLLIFDIVLLARTVGLRKDMAELESEIIYVSTGKYICQERNLTVWDALNKTANGEVLVDPQAFSERYVNEKTEKGQMSTVDTQIECGIDDLLTFQFTAFTTSGNAVMNVTAGGEKNRFYLGTTPTTYYMAIGNVTGIEDVSIKIAGMSGGVEVVIDDPYIVNWGTSYNSYNLEIGTKAYDNREVKVISSGSIIESGAEDVLVKDGILYSISSGSLYSYKLSDDESATLVATLNGLGPTDQLAFSKDKNALLVSCKQNGVYIVDISNPETLSILSHYDSLEAATGLFVADDYAFICSRTFGVEVVDISDLASPRHINTVYYDTEYVDCYVSDHYLLATTNSNSSVDIFDISDINEPVFVSSINVDGYSQGLCVKDNILYVATGINSSNKVKEKWQFGLGTGNGFELYDISDIETPVRLSSAKFDGRLNDTTYADWDIVVCDKYAFVADMYNGLYIYDISDPKEITCLSQNIVEIPADLVEGFEDISDGSHMYSWDTSAYSRATFSHAFFAGEKIYVSSPNMGIYCIDTNGLKIKEKEVKEVYNISASEKYLMPPEILGYEAALYESSACIWAVAVNDQYVYVAAGEAGILILDKDLNRINTIECENSVRDIKIRGDYVFTAESTSGVVSYKIEGDNLVRLSSERGSNENYYASSITLTGDGNYIIAQVSAKRHMVLNASNPEMLTVERKGVGITGSMIYRNICTGLVSSKYSLVYGKSGMVWYSSEDGVLSYSEVSGNKFYKESCGFAAYGDTVVATLGNGYKYFDFEGQVKSDLVEVPGTTDLSGKVAIENGIMVVSDTSSNLVSIIDVEDLNDPLLFATFRVSGNPDIATFDGRDIYLPCRYGGLLKLSNQ